jgi:hypothetical protein
MFDSKVYADEPSIIHEFSMTDCPADILSTTAVISARHGSAGSTRNALLFTSQNVAPVSRRRPRPK